MQYNAYINYKSPYTMLLGFGAYSPPSSPSPCRMGAEKNAWFSNDWVCNSNNTKQISPLT